MRQTNPVVVAELGEMQAILSDAMGSADGHAVVHPGELGWWFYHQDPRRPGLEWLMGDDAFAIVDRGGGEVSVFGRPGADRIPLLDIALARVDAPATVGFVHHEDETLSGALRERGFAPMDDHEIRYRSDIESIISSGETSVDGYEIRPLAGRHEAWTRRAASHAAFGSTMDPESHLERYLRFMRSPVYVPERDLVAITPHGDVAAFLVWWGDEQTGVTALEPVGTHPDHQRHGLATALLTRAAHDMRATGHRVVTVATGIHRTDATSFYGRRFEVDGRVDWWAQP